MGLYGIINQLSVFSCYKQIVIILAKIHHLLTSNGGTVYYHSAIHIKRRTQVQLHNER